MSSTKIARRITPTGFCDVVLTDIPHKESRGKSLHIFHPNIIHDHSFRIYILVVDSKMDNLFQVHKLYLDVLGHAFVVSMARTLRFSLLIILIFPIGSRFCRMPILIFSASIVFIFITVLLCFSMEPRTGLEPATSTLQVLRSAN